MHGNASKRTELSVVDAWKGAALSAIDALKGAALSVVDASKRTVLSDVDAWKGTNTLRQLPLHHIGMACPRVFQKLDCIL